MADQPSGDPTDAAPPAGSGCATRRSPTSAGSARTTRTPGYAGAHLLVDRRRRRRRGPRRRRQQRRDGRRSASSTNPPPATTCSSALAGAIHRAHDRIAELVEQDPELDGTSTTVTAALFDGTRIGVAHVGDSRGYLLRDGTLSPAHQGPHLRAEPDRRGPDHRGGVARPPAPQPDPARRRRGARARARPVPRRRSRPATGSCSAPTAPPACSTDERLAGILGTAPSTTPPSSWSAPRSTPAAPTTSPSSWPT